MEKTPSKEVIMKEKTRPLPPPRRLKPTVGGGGVGGVPCESVSLSETFE